MKLSFIIIVILFTVSNVLGQVQQEWVARFNGTGNGDDLAYYIEPDKAGNVYVTGRSWRGESNGSFDVLTVKYSSSGQILWSKYYNGFANNVDDARVLRIDEWGNVFVAGWTCGNAGCFECLLIKYSSDGVELWSKNYSYNNGGGAFYDISTDDSGNVYAAGELYNQFNKDFILQKYSSNGVLLWTQFYNGPGGGDDIAYCVKAGYFGSVFIAGGSEGVNTDADYCIIKYNAAGTAEWIRRYNGPAGGDDIAYGITVDFFDNVYITGKSFFGGDLGIGSVTIKYYSNGNFGWFNSFNGPGNISLNKDATHFIDIDDQQNIYVTGWSGRLGSSVDYTTISYSQYGTQRWINFYGDTSRWWDLAWDIKVDTFNSVYVTGGSQTDGKSSEDYATVKYGQNGEQIWVMRYSGPAGGVDIANSVTADNNGNIFVTGWSTGNNFNFDYCTIKYSQPIGIQPVSTEVPSHFTLLQNYPNPFNPVTKIRFEIPQNSKITVNELTLLKIYDVLGMEVKTLVNQNLNPGVYEIEFDGSELAGGVYFYRLHSGEFTDTKKMILVK